MAVLCPGYNVAARAHADGSKWIMLCKDICLAGKHFSLDPSHPTYAHNPVTADYVDATAVPSMGMLGIRQVLKVYSETHGDHYTSTVVQNAIADWESFFTDRKIQ
jgi:hypothetical protein